MRSATVPTYVVFRSSILSAVSTISSVNIASQRYIQVKSRLDFDSMRCYALSVLLNFYKIFLLTNIHCIIIIKGKFLQRQLRKVTTLLNHALTILRVSIAFTNSGLYMGQG